MKKIEYLICRSKNWGPTRKLHSKLGGSTTLDPRLNCQVYVCKNYGEFVVMNRDLVSKPNGGYWCAVQVRNTETGEVSNAPDEFPFSEAKSAMVGADAQEVTPGPVVSRPSQPAPVVIPTPEVTQEPEPWPPFPDPVDTLPPLPETPQESAPLPPPPEPTADPAPVAPTPKAHPAQAAKKKHGRPAKAK